MSDYPQAFPHGDPTHGGDIGMTLRDWFAGQALAAVIQHGDPTPTDEPSAFAWIAGDAYRFADAMLAERGRQS